MSGAQLTYVRNDVRRWVTITITGPARLDDMVQAVERQAADGVWGYAMLCDERQTTASLSTPATHTLLDVIERLNRAHGRQGPIAVVCATEAQYGMARMCATLGEQRELDCGVFRSISAAETWLDARVAERRLRR